MSARGGYLGNFKCFNIVKRRKKKKKIVSESPFLLPRAGRCEGLEDLHNITRVTEISFLQ